MINNNVEDAINFQINKELWSAYLYLAMAMNFEHAGLPGIANWFRVQTKEEQAHAEIFINYLISRGGRVRLQPIEAVPDSWDTPLAAFEHTLEHEQKVTSLINNLYALADPNTTMPHAANLTGLFPSKSKKKTTHANSSTACA